MTSVHIRAMPRSLNALQHEMIEQSYHQKLEEAMKELELERDKTRCLDSELHSLRTTLAICTETSSSNFADVSIFDELPPWISMESIIVSPWPVAAKCSSQTGDISHSLLGSMSGKYGFNQASGVPECVEGLHDSPLQSVAEISPMTVTPTMSQIQQDSIPKTASWIPPEIAFALPETEPTSISSSASAEQDIEQSSNNTSFVTYDSEDGKLSQAQKQLAKANASVLETEGEESLHPSIAGVKDSISASAQQEEYHKNVEDLLQCKDEEINHLKSLYQNELKEKNRLLRNKQILEYHIRRASYKGYVDDNDNEETSDTNSNRRPCLLKVNISSHASRQRGIFKKMLYGVHMKVGKQEWTVYRKKKHFDRFHREMTEIYPELSALALPRSKLLRTCRAELIEQRKMALKHYLDALLAMVPNLPNCPLNYGDQALDESAVQGFSWFFRAE